MGDDLDRSDRLQEPEIERVEAPADESGDADEQTGEWCRLRGECRGRGRHRIPQGRQQALCRGEVLRPVDVEEGIDGIAGELDDGKAVARGPGIDLAHAFIDQSMAQLGGEAHRPQPEHRMRRPPEAAQARSASAAARAASRRATRSSGKNGVSVAIVTTQACPRPLLGGPAVPGEHARERPGEALDHIGDHRQAEGREPLRVAIGVEHELGRLRPRPRDHVLQDRPAAQSLAGTCRRRPCVAPGRRRGARLPQAIVSFRETLSPAAAEISEPIGS